MAPQADGLLVHSHLIGINRGLSQDTLLVDGGTLQHLLHPGGQLSPVLRHGLGRTLLHLAGIIFDKDKAVSDVLRQLGAFHGPHLIIRRQGLIQNSTEVGADSLQVLVGLRHGQHVREPGQLFWCHM